MSKKKIVSASGYSWLGALDALLFFIIIIIVIIIIIMDLSSFVFQWLAP